MERRIAIQKGEPMPTFDKPVRVESSMKKRMEQLLAAMQGRIDMYFDGMNTDLEFYQNMRVLGHLLEDEVVLGLGYIPQQEKYLVGPDSEKAKAMQKAFEATPAQLGMSAVMQAHLEQVREPGLTTKQYEQCGLCGCQYPNLRAGCHCTCHD